MLYFHVKIVPSQTPKAFKASEKAESLRESKTLYQRYLEEELPRGKRMLDEKISAVKASITELKQNPHLQMVHQTQQLEQDLAQ